MVQYFKEEEFLEAQKQRKKSLIIYFVVLAVFLAAAVFSFIYYRTLPYKSPKITTLKLIVYPITGAFVIFSFIYLGVSHKRVKRYFNLLKNIKDGLKEVSELEFIRYSNEIQDKDGVDMKAMIFYEWNRFKCDFFERKVLVFYEKEFPKFNEKDKVRVRTQGNVLYQYEMLDKDYKLGEKK